MLDFIFTQHALLEMNRRDLSKKIIKEVLEAPEQQWYVQKDRVIFQSRVPLGIPEKIYLVRVFVDMDKNPPEIVTAYKTSKIEKYWRKKP